MFILYGCLFSLSGQIIILLFFYEYKHKKNFVDYNKNNVYTYGTLLDNNLGENINFLPIRIYSDSDYFISYQISYFNKLG